MVISFLKDLYFQNLHLSCPVHVLLVIVDRFFHKMKNWKPIQKLQDLGLRHNFESGPIPQGRTSSSRPFTPSYVDERKHYAADSASKWFLSTVRLKGNKDKE